jgi:hypothetical protein
MSDLYVLYWRETDGWTWVTAGWDDGKYRSVDLDHYLTKNALFAALESFDTYKTWQRVKRSSPSKGKQNE